MGKLLAYEKTPVQAAGDDSVSYVFALVDDQKNTMSASCRGSRPNAGCTVLIRVSALVHLRLFSSHQLAPIYVHSPHN